MPSAGQVVAAGALIAGVVLAAHGHTFRLPFVFDDRASILDNPSIRHLWPLSDALSPPRGTGVTVAGRPILNLSFALNYAISGPATWSYHVLNLVIHALAGLTLLGFVHRTLTLPLLAERFCRHAWWLALTIAGLWTLHPLQTESVTYIVQRAESLMGLFYLLTMYCYVRSIDAPRPEAWQALAVMACLLGMGTKEVMVSAPLMVLLHDRTFVAGSFAAAWRRRRILYLALAGTWLLLGFDMIASAARGGTAGVGLGVSSWDYLLTQCRAIVLYLKLALWPHPLVIDYGDGVAGGLREVWPQALLLTLLFLGVAIAAWRRSAIGFVGAWFFLILAPSSSVVPVTVQTIAEHRMYLPLAAVIAVAVAGIYHLTDRKVGMVALAAIVAAGWLTFRRDDTYRSELTLWSDTVMKCPENARARTNLGLALVDLGRVPEAVVQYTAAIRIQPGNPVTQFNLCNALTRLGRPAEALPHGETAVRLDPNNANAQVDLGIALVALGRPAEAVPHYEEALRLEPQAADVQADLGAALLQSGRGAAAIEHLEAALRLEPDAAQTWCDLASARAQQGQPAAARQACERALALKPDFPEALYVLGNIEAEGENFAAAIGRYRRALALAPDYFVARNNLANALLVTGQIDEAIAQYRQILREQPDDRSVQDNLARAIALRNPGDQRR